MKRAVLLCIISLLVLSMVPVIGGCSVPQATFEASATGGPALLKVDFTNTTPTGLFKKVDEFRWDFGDGATLTTKSIEDPVSHEYTKAGTFNVTLTVVKNGEPPSTTDMRLKIDVAHGPLNKVKINPGTVELDIGQSQKFTAGAVDAYGNIISEVIITWDAGQAGTISPSGALTGSNKAGTYQEGVTVTATLDTISTKATAKVTIKPDPLEIVSVSPISLVNGEIKQLNTEATDQFGNLLDDVTVTWSILDTNAGSLTADGTFTAGQVADNYADAVQVQVKQGDLVRTAVTAVEVFAGALEKIYIAPDPAEIGIGMTQQFVAVGADKYGNRITGLNVNWSVVNKGGTIDNNGLFTAGNTPGDYEGTVKAEATVNGVTQSAAVDVKVEKDRIAFLSNRDYEDLNFDIYIMNIDGSDQHRLTYSNANLGRFSYSPDGRRLYYALEGTGGDVYNISDTGKWEFPVTTGKRFFEPAISPDGTKIAFQSWQNDTAEIYVTDIDGGNPVRLTNNTAYEDYPTWSPDGKKILFVSERDGNTEIYVMDADGSNQKRLTNNSASDTCPGWSPDGTQIIYQTLDLSKFHWVVIIMNADGTNSKKFLDVTYDCNFPAWSRDGTKVLFHSWKDPDQAEIYIVNRDGTNITRLTNNEKNDYGPIELPRKTGVAVSESSVIIPMTGKFTSMSVQDVTSMVRGKVVRIKTDIGSGSGAIISPDGLILTANHVITDAKEITVYVSDGKSYKATVKARDKNHDLALLKIAATGLPYVEISNFTGIVLGQSVTVLGYPLGNESLTVTSGLVSAISYDSGHNIIWIQTDSTINPGNSGGPMFDLRGRIIGIVDAKLVGVGVDNVGFAISANTAHLYLQDLLEEAGY